MHKKTGWPYERVDIIADESQKITKDRTCDKCGSIASEENPLLTADPLSRKVLCYSCTRKTTYWSLAGNKELSRIIKDDLKKKGKG